ncbi:MAG TPA: glycosyltransferase 87 family protein [Ktedonobacteraceae bacterium]|nr:glycosyltransferase 87 family protein [Ktedonobacteraceae bacterium]
MEQRSVFTQSTQSEVKPLLNYQWMKLFFAEDIADNRPIVELQRRAVWIGLAFILQALNEIDHSWYIPYLMPVGSLIPFALILGSFYAMWMAIRPARPQQAKRAAGYPARWQRIVLTLTLLLTIAGGIELGRGLMMCFLAPQFSNDGTSLDTNAAILLIEGRNPYTDSNMLDLARRFPIQPNWTTPLRVGQFANRLDYPTMVEFQTVLDTDLKAGAAPEFESKVSYPALSFLTLLPFALFKNYNVLPFYMLSYAALVFVAWRAAHPALRPWVLLLTMANIPMWSSTVGGNLDIFYALLIALVWLLRDHRWRSAIFFGLALASKQIAWFFIPFYLIMVYRQYGIKETAYRLTIAGSIGLAINLPFILWNPHAWLAGVLAPVVDPMFPMGVGIINLSVTHLLPFFPQWVYSMLEGAALLFSLAWYWRLCRKAPEAALLLAVLPLFFAWRSLPSYFYCSAFPIFILLIAKMRPSPEPAIATAGQSRMRKRMGALASIGI